MTRGVGGHGPANIMSHLKGIDFPADKKKLLSHAKQAKGADTDQVMEVLNRLPEKQYHTAAEVMKAMGGDGKAQQAKSHGDGKGQQAKSHGDGKAQQARGQEKGQSKGHGR